MPATLFFAQLAIGNPVSPRLPFAPVSYEVFARKYRPQTFDDVVGQEHITRTLRNAIEQNRLAHAYIFVGPRGTGKTSTARILAKSLNCLAADGPTTQPCGKCDLCKEIAAGTSLDVLEFDAASNTQVDKVRDLIIDNVKYAPARARYKVYLVDEVHMLSTNSFNALLKTLEEPPGHVKFIFATTDVQKVPTTILSRCQRFDLKRIPTALIAEHLLGIAKNEKLKLAPEAAEAIARGAEGGMRDAESMLDQLVAFCGNTIAEDEVLSVFGLTGQQTVAGLCEAIVDNRVADALRIVHEQAENGRDLARLMSDLIAHLRNLLVAHADPSCLAGELSAEAVQQLVDESQRIPSDKLLELIEQFAGAESRMRWAPNRKMHFEVAVIRAAQTLSQATLSEVLETLTAMRGGQAPPAASLPPKREPAPARAAKPAPKEPARAVIQETPKAAPAPEPEPEPVAEEADPSPSPDFAESETVAPVAAEIAIPIDDAPLEIEPTPAVEEVAAELNPEQVWARLVEQVRAKRPLIRMWVENGRLESLGKGKATIIFPSEQSIAADYIQQASHKQFLEEVLSEIAGSPLTLRVDLREGLAPVTSATATRGNATATPAVDPVAEFRNDPLIQKALELFKAEIQPA